HQCSVETVVDYRLRREGLPAHRPGLDSLRALRYRGDDAGEHVHYRSEGDVAKSADGAVSDQASSRIPRVFRVRTPRGKKWSEAEGSAVGTQHGFQFRRPFDWQEHEHGATRELPLARDRSPGFGRDRTKGSL